MSGPIRSVLMLGTAAAAVWFGLAAVPAGVERGAQPAGGIELDADDIGGVVTSANGPEAGVWVIAETTDLPTRFIRSVVTD
ncbi:MAG: hypothetical protein OXQ28_04440, partial [Acidobacteriota bacterium]|nr:hypothetical protein [Acidobacteriota bacterium]